MHNARIRILVFLWICLPWIGFSAGPPPAIVRSVLTTNFPAFGNPGEFLTRQAGIPYLLWVPSPGDTVLSNYVVALSNLMWTADNNVSNWVNAVSNYVWASDNIVSNYVGAVSNLANGGSGAYIKSLNGSGTNLNVFGSNTNDALIVNTTNVTKSVQIFSTGGISLGNYIPTDRFGFGLVAVTDIVTNFFTSGDLGSGKVEISGGNGQNAGDASVFNTNLSGGVGGSLTFAAGSGGACIKATNSAVGGNGGTINFSSGPGTAATLTGTNGSVSGGNSGDITFSVGSVSAVTSPPTNMAGPVVGSIVFSTPTKPSQTGFGSSAKGGDFKVTLGGSSSPLVVCRGTGIVAGTFIFKGGNGGAGSPQGGNGSGFMVTLGNAGNCTNGPPGSAGTFHVICGNAATGLTANAVGGGFSLVPGASAGTSGGGKFHVGRTNSEANIYAMFTNTTTWYDTFRIDAPSRLASFIVSSNGLAGIGTNSPQSALHVNADNSANLITQFGTTNQPQMFCIDTNGHVGFGTNAPQANFDFFAQSNGPSQYILRIANGMIANQTNTVLVGTNGGVGINAEPGVSTYTLNVGGVNSIRTVGGASFNGSFSAASATITGNLAVGTNTAQSRLHVTADNSAANATIIQTTNKFISRWDTNGNQWLTGTLAPTNGIINQGSASSIANLTITTNSTQIWCLNGTNQLVTLPDCTKIPAYQIYRFSVTNGNAKIIYTNATGTQTIRNGQDLSLTQIGVGETGLFTDGAAWWLASKNKNIEPNASWSSTTNVPLTSTAATSNYVTFNQQEFNNSQGIALVNGYQLYITNAGIYFLTYSAVTKCGHNGDVISLWLQQSDQNMARTRTDCGAQTTSVIPQTVNFIVSVTTNNTYFSLVGRASGTGCDLDVGAAGDATMPVCPSVILTVNRVSDGYP